MQIKLGFFETIQKCDATTYALQLANFFANGSYSVAVIESEHAKNPVFSYIKGDIQEDGTIVTNGITFYPSGTGKESYEEDILIYDYGVVGFRFVPEKNLDRLFLCTNASTEGLESALEFSSEVAFPFYVLLQHCSKAELASFKQHYKNCYDITEKRLNRCPAELDTLMSVLLGERGLFSPSINSADWNEEPVLEFVSKEPVEKEKKKVGLSFFKKKKATGKEPQESGDSEALPEEEPEDEEPFFTKKTEYSYPKEETNSLLDTLQFGNLKKPEPHDPVAASMAELPNIKDLSAKANSEKKADITSFDDFFDIEGEVKEKSPEKTQVVPELEPIQNAAPTLKPEPEPVSEPVTVPKAKQGPKRELKKVKEPVCVPELEPSSEEDSANAADVLKHMMKVSSERMKELKEKDRLRKEEIKRQKRTEIYGHISIFVTSMRHSVGCSYVAGSLGFSLAEKYSKKVCLCHKSQTHFPEEGFLTEYTESVNFEEAYKNKIVILDRGIFGEFTKAELVELRRSDTKIMVSTGLESDIKLLAKFIYKSGEAAKNWFYVFNMVTSSARKRKIEELMQEYQIYFLPVHDYDSVPKSIQKNWLKELKKRGQSL